MYDTEHLVEMRENPGDYYKDSSEVNNLIQSHIDANNVIKGMEAERDALVQEIARMRDKGQKIIWATEEWMNA